MKKRFKSWIGKNISKRENEKSICMCCGKKSESKLKYSVCDKEETIREFCSTKCLIKYYKTSQNQRKAK